MANFCVQIWDRDEAESLNILRITLHFLLGLARPFSMQRRASATAEEAEEEEEEEEVEEEEEEEDAWTIDTDMEYELHYSDCYEEYESADE